MRVCKDLAQVYLRGSIGWAAPSPTYIVDMMDSPFQLFSCEPDHIPTKLMTTATPTGESDVFGSGHDGQLILFCFIVLLPTCLSELISQVLSCPASLLFPQTSLTYCLSSVWEDCFRHPQFSEVLKKQENKITSLADLWSCDAIL
ncbi:hypothetical protein [Alkaliphilus metalliredigens]|uniref:hypothetical protein n=1 Tax=Alkaliphilus metalliredigens TaxID=208226 RepID=UPI00059FCF3A|nr:hypothetical protein [Alkaliphilus metalliredigens]